MGKTTRTDLSLLVLLAGSIVLELRYALCYEFGGFVRVQGLLRLAVLLAGRARSRGRWRWSGIIVDVISVNSGRVVVCMADRDIRSRCEGRSGCHCAEVRGTQVLGALWRYSNVGTELCCSSGMVSVSLAGGVGRRGGSPVLFGLIVVLLVVVMCVDFFRL